MKKSLLLIALSLFMIGAPEMANAQAVKEGTILIDAYYGYGSLYTAAFKAAYANSGSPSGVKVTGLGPLGVRGEYLVTDKLGLGGDIGFNSTKVTQDQLNSSNNVYRYTFYTQKIGVMVTFNYHFITKDNLDFYGVFGGGYGERTYTFTSTEPGYSEPTVKGLVPISAKLGLGIRYFFNDQVGFNMGIGFGQGGILNGGLTIKI